MEWCKMYFIPDCFDSYWDRSDPVEVIAVEITKTHKDSFLYDDPEMEL